ncbi:hypothetical protein AJ87_21210 [Rhizobium yanglingense]|nr:hypothetical protein AJ87_21210 [Rhizobium yanglingense]
MGPNGGFYALLDKSRPSFEIDKARAEPGCRLLQRRLVDGHSDIHCDSFDVREAEALQPVEKVSAVEAPAEHGRDWCFSIRPSVQIFETRNSGGWYDQS